jgi:hypothetical protein
MTVIKRTTSAPTNGTSEIETLTIGGTPTGGTFKLAFEGFTTASITWSATNATLLANINTALQALPSFGGATITATAGTLTAGIGTVTLTFSGNRGKQAISNKISVAENSLTGTSPTLATSVTTPGVSATKRGSAAGTLLVETVTPKLYKNTGTGIAPTWTQQ